MKYAIFTDETKDKKWHKIKYTEAPTKTQASESLKILKPAERRHYEVRQVSKRKARSIG